MAENDRKNSSKRRKPVLIGFGIGILVVLFAVSIYISIHQIRKSFAPPAFLPTPDQEFYQKRLSGGKFLVADQHQKDPFFQKSVILLIKYDSQGAMGLMINRPSELDIHKLFPEMEKTSQKTVSIYYGGPVETNRAFLLICSQNIPAEVECVLDDVYFSPNRKELERLRMRRDAREKYRIFIGYTGWKPYQLEQEISKGGWKIIEADAAFIFDKPVSEMWAALISKPGTP